MRKIFLVLLTLLGTVTLFGAQKADPGYGFAMVGFGRQDAAYSSRYTAADGSTISTVSKNVAPYYATGSLVKLNRRFDLGLQASSTLFAQSSSETFNFGDEVDEHKLDMTVSQLTFSLHNKLDRNSRIVFALGYSYELLKRYNFNSDNPFSPLGLIENSIAAFYTEVGYVLSNGYRLGEAKWHYLVEIHAGLPFLSINTRTFPTQEPASKSNVGLVYGYSIRPRLYGGYHFARGAEVGLFYEFYYRTYYDKRELPYGDSVVTSDSQTLKRQQVGISALWRF